MLPTHDASLDVFASSSLVQFAAFLLIGAVVGWLLNDPLHGGACCPPIAIIGVCGAWIGGEAAVLIGRVDRGGWNEFAAAVIGAMALAWFWRRHHAPVSPLDRDIAARPPHA
jgi:uncharacterized membrane protein YeaQ/YmgE (transglycosylase-associated protein family)